MNDEEDPQKIVLKLMCQQIDERTDENALDELDIAILYLQNLSG